MTFQPSSRKNCGCSAMLNGSEYDANQATDAAPKTGTSTGRLVVYGITGALVAFVAWHTAYHMSR